MENRSMYEVINRMNQLRKQSNQLGCGLVLLFFLPIPIIMIGPTILFWNNDNLAKIVTVILFLVYMVVIVVAVKTMGSRQRSKLDELKRLYKQTFMNGVLEDFFEDVNYRWDRGITQQQFFATGIYREYKPYSYHSEDYLRGTYQGVSFEQSDVELQIRKNDNTITIFSGRIFEFDYSIKKVQSVKVVPQIAMLNPEHYRIDGNMNVVKMENMEFNEIFAVASESPEEAFYVITPQVMERLLMIYNKYSKSTRDDGSRNNIQGIHRTIAFHFKRDKLYVAIDHMDSFDSNLLTDIDYPTEKEKIRKHIQVIIDIIEMLKLINA